MAAMQLIALYNVRFPVDITRILPQPMDAGAVGMWAGPNVFSALTLLLHHPPNE